MASTAASAKLSDLSEQLSLAPSSGLGIEGVSGPQGYEQQEDPTSRSHTPEQFDSYSSTTPTVVQDGPSALPLRERSSYIKYLVVSLLSTTLSLIYVVIALRAPVWPQMRDPLIAKTVASLTAKLIEACFGSICVLYLGQLLTRRSTDSHSFQGVSLDQICMRDWIIDPPSMFSDEKVLWLGPKSFLGWYVMVAGAMCLLYGTASTNLIQPTLRDTSAIDLAIGGIVNSSFGNESYIEARYRSTLVQNHTQESDRSMMSILYSARGGDCWSTYLKRWDHIEQSARNNQFQLERPAPWFLDKDTQGQINGSWVQPINMTDTFNKFGRVVNNVTLALPHPGVLQSTRRSKSVPQPQEFDGGLGRYSLQAEVPSPFLNVLCTNVQRTDLKGLVYEDQVKGQFNTSKDFVVDFDWDNFASVKTPVDNIFDWNDSKERPIFYRYPLPEQTLLNKTVDWDPYKSNGRDSVYLLGAPESNAQKSNASMDYVLCSITAGLLASCYTELNVGGNSSVLISRCGNKNVSYRKRNTTAVDTVKSDWVAVGSLAATSLALNIGETASNNGGGADNPAFLTRLILMSAVLKPDQASTAEGLASMLMPSLAMAAQDSPFDITSNPPNDLKTASSYTQPFPAKLKPALFASGGEVWYKQLLYTVVFILVFLTNVYMLYYLFYRHRNVLTVDICDPMNLFGLAANSTFNSFPESKQILSPKKDASIRPLSMEWKIKSEGNGKMAFVDVVSGREVGGSPNDAGGESGLTPLMRRQYLGRKGHAREESVEMV